jgi:putative ubiquitin-RnfH superfamily antitoxin RatB of RatAB toxin-antitoxin module
MDDSSKEQIADVPSIQVEVAYALPDEQFLQALTVKQGTSAMAAVLASGLTSKYPEVNIGEAKMGIFSKPLDGKHLPLPADYQLENNDRVEIYRPLLLDPKQARFLRAQKKAKQAQAKQTEKNKRQRKVV